MQNEVNLIKEGEKVGQSESTLLNMLQISPFTYGLIIEHGIYSGFFLIEIFCSKYKSPFFSKGKPEIVALYMYIYVNKSES